MHLRVAPHVSHKFQYVSYQTFNSRDLSAVSNDNLGRGRATVASEGLDLLDDVHAVRDGSKDGVLSIEPVGLNGAKEELRPVGVGSSIGHGENSGPGVLESEVLVGELLSVDGLSSGAVLAGEVTALAHEVLDDTVEGGALVAESLLASAEGAEVLGALGGDVGAEGHLDAAEGATVGGHIKEADRVRHFQLFYVKTADGEVMVMVCRKNIERNSVLVV